MIIHVSNVSRTTIGDSMGSVIGYDALCRSPADSHSVHDTSRHSTPEHAHRKSDNGKFFSFNSLSFILL